MSIHKKDIESLLEAFTAVHSKGNTKASGELVPHLIRSVVRYIEAAAGIETAVEPAPAPVAPTLSDADKAFAVAATKTALAENGNATIETDKGNIAITADKHLDAESGLDLTGEIARALVQEVEKEGATVINAVTSKVEEAVEAIEEKVEEKTAPKKAPAKKA